MDANEIIGICLLLQNSKVASSILFPFQKNHTYKFPFTLMVIYKQIALITDYAEP